MISGIQDLPGEQPVQVPVVGDLVVVKHHVRGHVGEDTAHVWKVSLEFIEIRARLAYALDHLLVTRLPEAAEALFVFIDNLFAQNVYVGGQVPLKGRLFEPREGPRPQFVGPSEQVHSIELTQSKQMVPGMIASKQRPGAYYILAFLRSEGRVAQGFVDARDGFSPAKQLRSYGRELLQKGSAHVIRIDLITGQKKLMRPIEWFVVCGDERII